MAHFRLNIALDVSDDEATALADALGCAPGDLEGHLARYASAAVREYADMFAGQAMISVADLRERRLVAILLALPAAEFPTDDRIARLFNMTSSQGRTLLRNTLSRHRVRLKDATRAAARNFVLACRPIEGEGDREARCQNAVIIDMLNAQLAAAAVLRKPILKKEKSFDTYVVTNGAYNELRALYP